MGEFRSFKRTLPDGEVAPEAVGDYIAGPNHELPTALHNEGAALLIEELAGKACDRPSAFATQVTLTGRFFTAEEALAAGIINRVAPEGRHLEVDSHGSLNRRVGWQPSAWGREIQPVGPPRGAARHVKDLSAISPDAEIRPYRRPIDLQAGFSKRAE